MVRRRVQSIDVVRGLVMVIMAIDHVRDFTNAYSQQFQPEDLQHTTTAMFLTRWITHFCAPTFVFLAGTSVALTAERKTKSEISRLLVTRGLWLIVAEVTVVSFGMNFNLSYSFVLLQVIWAIGWSMLVLAALIRVPWSALLAIGLAIVAGHNLLDGVRPESFGAWAWLWRMLHVGGSFFEWAPGRAVLSAYPVLPWMGVMTTGYCFGRLYRSTAAVAFGHEGPLIAPERRRAVLLTLGAAMTLAFLVIRYANGYGDLVPWRVPSRPELAWMSFLNATKYPPSLDYVLMTLGPAIFLLGVIDRLSVSARNPLLVFGTVPFFFYLCHWYLLHAVAVALAWFRFGRAGFALQMLPSFDPAATGVPPDYGYSLATTYLIWAAIVAALYPICLWYSRLKATKNTRILSYL